MEEKLENSTDAKELMCKSFKVAVWGAAICVVSSILDIISAVKESDSLETPATLILILGLLVWGIGLAGAGNKLTSTGHTSTGVTSAGGALIFWALVELTMLLFLDEDAILSGGAKFWIFFALELIGPAIFYLSLKQEKNKEDKFFDTAATGIGAVAICYIVTAAALLIVFYTMKGGGMSQRTMGSYVVVEYSKGAGLGFWIAEHYKLVMIVISSVTTIGFLMAFGSMCTYDDFLKDLKEEKDKKDDEKLVKEVIKEYKEKKEGSDEAE